MEIELVPVVISSFGHQLRFDLNEGFPAVTTKSLAWKGVVSELLWFLEGSDDERRLAEIRFQKDRSELTDLTKFSTIWTDNADNQGVELGYENTPTPKNLALYMVSNGETGQALIRSQELIDGLRSNPYGKKAHILSAWNVEKIDAMALAAHAMLCLNSMLSTNGQLVLPDVSAECGYVPRGSF